MKPFAVYDDTKGQGACRACHALLDWYETPQGRRMPVERGAVPTRSEHDDAHRLVLSFDAADSHFANCPQAAAFRGRH